MYIRAVLAGAVAAALVAAPASGQNPGERIERVVVSYNEDGMARITPPAVEGFLRALYAEQVAGGDYWKSGGFDFPIEFRKVEERVRAFLAIAFQGTKAALFSAEELAALEARRKDLEAALKHDWANVNFATPGAQPAPTSEICAQLAARLREIEAAWRLAWQRTSERATEIGRALHTEVLLRDVAVRLHEEGRRGVTEQELSRAEMERWANEFGAPISPSMRDSPYAFYLTVAGKAHDRAALLQQNPVKFPTGGPEVRRQLDQNNCPREPQP